MSKVLWESKGITTSFGYRVEVFREGGISHVFEELLALHQGKKQVGFRKELSEVRA